MDLFNFFEKTALILNIDIVTVLTVNCVKLEP